MKILNGRKYFDKKDVKEVQTLAKAVVLNPYDDQEFLSKATEDDRKCVIKGITALANTIAWEFSTETAVSINKIKELASSLSMPASEKVSFEQFTATPMEKVSKHTILRYENWLRNVGIDILMDEFKKM